MWLILKQRLFEMSLETLERLTTVYRAFDDACCKREKKATVFVKDLQAVLEIVDDKLLEKKHDHHER